MSYIEQVRGVDVLQDWDNFFESKLADYYTVKEEVVGEWFTIDKGVVSTEVAHGDSSVMSAINSTKLPTIMRSIKQDLVVVAVVAGPDIKGNPYNLDKKKAFIVDIFNRATGLFFTPPELIAFVDKISTNPYGAKFVAGPIVGLVDFKAAVQAIKDLKEDQGEDADTSQIESNVLASLNLVLHNTPSTINPELEKQGLLFAGLFGYTFNYA